MAYDPIYDMWNQQNPNLDRCIDIYESDYEENPEYMRDEEDDEC